MITKLLSVAEAISAGRLYNIVMLLYLCVCSLFVQVWWCAIFYVINILSRLFLLLLLILIIFFVSSVNVVYFTLERVILTNYFICIISSIMYVPI